MKRLGVWIKGINYSGSWVVDLEAVCDSEHRVNISVNVDPSDSLAQINEAIKMAACGAISAAGGPTCAEDDVMLFGGL